MKIALVNPNSTASMTDKVRAVAKQYAFAGTEILATNPDDTPPSIEGHYDEAVSVPGLLREIKKAEQWGADGYIVACFDDPGLGACREIVSGPVIGLCEAAMRAASAISTSFSVVTTLSRSVPIVESLAHHYGVSHQCRRVRAAEVPVLSLEEEGSDAESRISDEIATAVREDGCESIILGCAGMADLASRMTKRHQLPVLDGVLCALKWCEALVGANLKTSKIGAYAYPRKK